MERSMAPHFKFNSRRPDQENREGRRRCRPARAQIQASDNIAGEDDLELRQKEE
jgi:hypothetical protein